MTKKKDNLAKKITSFSDNAIWTTYPLTVKWLQEQRKTMESFDIESIELHRGVNATIILLSAACLEGFLVDCLKSYVANNRFAARDTFEGRLDHDFLNRISTATFNDFPDLFRLTLGNPLSALISDTDLIEGIRTLINFRNGIAHARSVIHQSSIVEPEGDEDYEIEHQYHDVHKYLEGKNLIYGQQNLFSDKIADHFASLIKSYIDAVLPLIPTSQTMELNMNVSLAYPANKTKQVTK
ncbi:MAG: hypothetical protein JWQ71_998 [Pedosphaera sp.]|nr:hypothetical protein [Pedosphaera sp.]